MTNYENQGGLLVKPGTNECAGYLLHFEGHGAYDPEGRVMVDGVALTKEQIDTHNKIIADAELKAAIVAGKGVFYFTNERKDPCYTAGRTYVGTVTNWGGTFKAPWVYAEKFEAAAYGGAIDAFNVWFTGPDGKKWYGVQKGENQILKARRLKKQDK